MYGRISDGIEIMEMKCIQADLPIRDFDGNEDDASIERTHRSFK